MWVRTMEILPNMFNRAPPTIAPALVEEVLQDFVENIQVNSMLVLPAG